MSKVHFIRFPDYTPVPEVLGVPIAHTAQMRIDVRWHLDDLLQTVTDREGMLGVEVVTHWNAGIVPDSLMRLGWDWNQGREFDLEGNLIGHRGIAWIEQNGIDTEKFYGISSETRRDALPHEIRIAAENAKRQAEFDAKGGK